MDSHGFLSRTFLAWVEISGMRRNDVWKWRVRFKEEVSKAGNYLEKEKGRKIMGF